MIDSVKIREATGRDFTAIERLYPDAFPDEELRPLVRALLQDTPEVLSLVATAESRLVGHVVFTPCSVIGGSATVALLGPLAVASDRQRAGIGSKLVGAGLDQLRLAAVEQVLVLGDPAYYGRFGFEAERSVAPPFALPKEWGDAWQSIKLRRSAPRRSGRLSVPPAWNQPALWSP